MQYVNPKIGGKFIVRENEIFISQGREYKHHSIPLAYIFRLIFTLLGVLFIVFFTARGIYQIAYTLINCPGDIRALFTNDDLSRYEHWIRIRAALKHSPGAWLDLIITVFCNLIFIHGALGLYYIIRTEYKRVKENILLFLQIFSAAAAVLAIMALMRDRTGSGSISAVISILIALISSFHIGNGLYNACITLGISVSENTKTVSKTISWVIALISILQITILFV
jgi:hypothetical protein